jgi:hypothetical protein
MMNDFEEKKTLLYIANGLSNKNFVKINVEKIADQATNKGVEKVKKITFTHSIQPIVESGLQKINEKSNEYIDKSIARLEKKLDAVILIQEKQASYFDNSIGVSETAKEELKQAILGAKKGITEVESVIEEETIEPTPKKATATKLAVER